MVPEPAAFLVARVLALDISTSVCGAAVLDIWTDASITVERVLALDAATGRAAFLRSVGQRKGDTEMERFARIRIAARGLASVDGCFDHLAYEVPNQRGAGATAGLWQAIGAVLERVQPSVPVPLLPVHASTAKAVVGTAGVRAAGETATDLDEKGRAIEWLTDALLCQSDGDQMMAKLRTLPRPEQEAIADAVAVGVATVPMLLPGQQACCDRRKSLPKPKGKRKTAQPERSGSAKIGNLTPGRTARKGN